MSTPVGDEDGFTLLELVVTMSVFGGVMALVFAVLGTVQRDTVRVADRETAVTSSRQAVAQIDRQVRSGNVLFAPGNEAEGQPHGTAGCSSPVGNPSVGNCMRVYTQSNGAERCVQWQVTPDPAVPGTSSLRTRSWSPTWSTDAIVSDWSVVARGIVSAGQPPFALQGGSTAYNSRLLDVRVRVKVKDSDRTEEVATSLSGRNTFYGYDPNTCNPVPPA